MGDHLKRLVAPTSWSIARKTAKFVSKTSPGPHNANAMPVAVWLRDHMGYATTLREVKQILHQRDLLVNGRAVSDARMGIGIFDIVALPKIGRYYRILRDKNGRHKSITIDAASADTKLAKIVDKTTVAGGKVQLNLRDGSNVIADNTYHARDSVVLSLKPEDRYAILDHFPYEVGNMAMVIGGRHSGNVARIVEIIPVPGSVANRVVLEDEKKNARFETVDTYVYMIGRTEPAISEWGIEE
jgi:small subunit ribosomal protein S4e